MGTTSEKLAYLQETKEAIKDAIVNKGVEVTEDTTFREYATKIGEISGVKSAILTNNATNIIEMNYLDFIDINGNKIRIDNYNSDLKNYEFIVPCLMMLITRNGYTISGEAELIHDVSMFGNTTEVYYVTGNVEFKLND